MDKMWVVGQISRAIKAGKIIRVGAVSVGPRKTAVSDGLRYAVIEGAKERPYAVPANAAKCFVDLVGVSAANRASEGN